MSGPTATTTPPTNTALARRVFERSDRVLWSLSGTGIVLHNFDRRQFLELDMLGYRLWGFLDGGRTVEQAIARAWAAFDETVPVSQAKRESWEIIEVLVENGFIEERRAGA
jgi:hypothetical protein